MDTQYTSDNFYHFVGYHHPTDHQKNFNILKKILSDGCVSHWPHKNDHGTVGYEIDWDGSLTTENLLKPCVTCFGDIPEESLGIHINKYGPFGVSFPREHLIVYGARPVMYIPMHPLEVFSSLTGKMLLNDLEAAYRGFNECVASKHDNSQDEWVRTSRRVVKVPTDEPSAIKAMESVFARHFLAFIKPFDSNLKNGDHQNYYMEREWRKFGNLKFEPDHVCKVFVAKGFKSELEKILPGYVGKVEEIKTV